MAEIQDVKFWKKRGKDARVYVHTVDGREGCYYIDGNNWNEKGTWDGKLTDEEIARARALSIWDDKWHTIYDNEMPARIAEVDGVTLSKTEDTAQDLPRNRYADHCAACGKYLQVGEGHLMHLTDEEDIDRIGQGKAWVVYCIDTEACKRRRDEALQGHQAEIQRARARQEKLDQERALLIERLAPLELQMDWSWDDFSYSLGEVLAETENLIAREYKFDNVIVGFVIKERK